MAASNGKQPLFSAAELQPQTGYPAPLLTQANREALTAREALVRSIYVHNPNHRRVMTALDLVLASGVAGVSQTAVRNAAPSFAGKSSAADEFSRIVEARGLHRPGERPVVRAELEQACTPKRMWTAVLKAYGDDFAAVGDEEKLRRRAYEAIEANGTRLLIIDEIQHAGYRSQGGSVPTDVIKRVINDAVVGLALFGNEDAATLLESNPQLGNRMIAPCDIKPLEVTAPADQATFIEFLRLYDAALVAKGLFASSSELDDSRTALCLMEISKGFLGRVVTLVTHAGRRAFLRSADRIEVCDLAAATAEWAIAQKLCKRNPFHIGH